MVRENGNAFANAYKYIKEQNEAEANKHRAAVAEAAQKHQDAINRIYDIRESREIARTNHNKLLEDCKNDALATIIKAIYIEALVPGSLTDNALFLAESMVDGWIQEKGGASKIMGACKNKTYLLNRICTIAEEVALEDVEEIEADESDGLTASEKKVAEDEKKAKVTQMLAQANSLIAKATALQNGDDSVLDSTDDAPTETEEEVIDVEEEPAEDGAEDTTASEEPASDDDVIDASQPVEEEEDTEAAADDTAETKKEEKAEEEAPEEEPEAEKDDEKEDESEESEDKEDDDDDSDDDEDEDDDDNELTSDDDSDEEDNTLADPDMGDIEEEEPESSEEIEAGEDEDQQDAEAELTGESLDDDTVEEDEQEIDNTSIDGENTEPQGKIFDELDKEEEVQKAVETIAQRVADAEEDFIKRNAEDKKKIDDLLGKLSDNIKTVEQLSNDDSIEGKKQADIAQEHANIIRREIKSVTANRPQSVFERMARKLTESVTKDPDTRAIYLAESGRTDIGNVVEHTKVMYGFLETLRTLQLENVDSQYIENVLKSM